MNEQKAPSSGRWLFRHAAPFVWGGLALAIAGVLARSAIVINAGRAASVVGLALLGISVFLPWGPRR